MDEIRAPSETSVKPASWLERKLWHPLMGQLKQGTTPEKLARSISMGAILALFPIYGATTSLCFLAGIVFQLNPIAIQTVNYLATPIQIAALPILIKSGEWLFGLQPISFNPSTLAKTFFADPMAFLNVFGKSAMAGVFIWLLVALPAIPILERFCTAVLRRRHKETS